VFIRSIMRDRICSGLWVFSCCSCGINRFLPEIKVEYKRCVVAVAKTVF